MFDPRSPLDRQPLPVITVCALTPDLRSAAAGSVLVDLDHGVQISYDLDIDRGVLRRTVHDLGGLIEDVGVDLDDPCLACSVRADFLRTAMLWVEHRRPIVLALPVTLEPMEIIQGINAHPAGRLVAGQVVAVLEAETVEDDLFGDDLLVERDPDHDQSDRRSVGEALARQLESADVVSYAAPITDRAGAVLDHLLTEPATHRRLHRLDGAALLRPRLDILSGSGGCGNLSRPWRGNPTFPPVVRVPDRHGVWTIELASPRPFSPSRLRNEITALGGGRVRGRGRLWLPTRPGLRCAWDGVGGQLSIGPAGEWKGEPESRLVITGIAGDPEDYRAAFERALLTEAEMTALSDAWESLDDGLDPWLGARADLRR